MNPYNFKMDEQMNDDMDDQLPEYVEDDFEMDDQLPEYVEDDFEMDDQLPEYEENDFEMDEQIHDVDMTEVIYGDDVFDTEPLQTREEIEDERLRLESVRSYESNVLGYLLSVIWKLSELITDVKLYIIWLKIWDTQSYNIEKNTNEQYIADLKYNINMLKSSIHSLYTVSRFKSEITSAHINFLSDLYEYKKENIYKRKMFFYSETADFQIFEEQKQIDIEEQAVADKLDQDMRDALERGWIILQNQLNQQTEDRLNAERVQYNGLTQAEHNLIVENQRLAIKLSNKEFERLLKEHKDKLDRDMLAKEDAARRERDRLERIRLEKEKREKEIRDLLNNSKRVFDEVHKQNKDIMEKIKILKPKITLQSVIDGLNNLNGNSLRVPLSLNSVEKAGISPSVPVIGKIDDHKVYGKGYYRETGQSYDCGATIGLGYERLVYEKVAPVLGKICPNFLQPVVSLDFDGDDYTNIEATAFNKLKVYLEQSTDSSQDKYCSRNKKKISVFFTDFIEHVTLRDFISTHNNNSNFPNHINKIIIQIILALAAMSTEELMHNDLHTGNIMIETLKSNTTLYYNLGKNLQYEVPNVKYKVYIFDWDFGFCGNKQLIGVHNNKKIPLGEFCENNGICDSYDMSFDLFLVLCDMYHSVQDIDFKMFILRITGKNRHELQTMANLSGCRFPNIVVNDNHPVKNMSYLFRTRAFVAADRSKPAMDMFTTILTDNYTQDKLHRYSNV
jgi:hypothetical protein